MPETTESPELLEAQQIYTAAAMIVAYQQVLGKTASIVNVVDELKKFSDDSTDRLYDIVSGHWKYIDYLVQEIFDATITP